MGGKVSIAISSVCPERDPFLHSPIVHRNAKRDLTTDAYISGLAKELEANKSGSRLRVRRLKGVGQGPSLRGSLAVRI